MDILLKRREFTASTTIGELYIDGMFECFSLEDKYRSPGEQKIKGKTAIPCAVYEIILNQSQRFKRIMPLLVGGADFAALWQGVRIHWGNTSEDTDGCILVGYVKHQNQIYESKKAFDALFAKLEKVFQAGETIRITVINDPVKGDVNPNPNEKGVMAA